MHALFYELSVFFVLSGLLCAATVAADIAGGRRQSMPVMNFVWPLTALWASWLGLLAYFTLGRAKHAPLRGEMNPAPAHAMHMNASGPSMNHAMKDMPNMKMPAEPVRPTLKQITLSTLHCGAGCTLADIIGETLTVFLPLALVGSALAGQWTLDYALALAIGVLFQYAAIQSMQKLPKAQAVKRALRVDFWSLTAWQAGMYGLMAAVIFGGMSGELIPKNSWQFWFVMQLAMCAGFVTSFPANYLLIRAGIKPAMMD